MPGEHHVRGQGLPRHGGFDRCHRRGNLAGNRPTKAQGLAALANLVGDDQCKDPLFGGDLTAVQALAATALGLKQATFDHVVVRKS